MFYSNTEYSARFFLVAKINISHCRDLFVLFINFFFAMIDSFKNIQGGNQYNRT